MSVQPKPFMMFGPQGESRGARAQMNRSFKKASEFQGNDSYYSRVEAHKWGVQYQAGAIIWSNIDGQWFADAMAKIILHYAQHNLSNERDLSGLKRTAWSSYRYRRRPPVGSGKTGWERAKISRETKVDLDESIIDGRWPGKKPRKPTKPKYPKNPTPKAMRNYAKRVNNYEQKVKNYKELIRRYNKKKEYAKTRKSHFRFKGKYYRPTKKKRAIMYSGLMVASLRVGKPYRSRWAYERDASGKRVKFHKSGWQKISVSKKRSQAAFYGKYFDWGPNSEIQRDIDRALHFVHARATKRYNYQRANKMAKQGFLIGKRILEHIIMAAARRV